MKHTATHRIPATTGRRRGPAVIALAMAAGVALGACSADPATDPAPAPATQAAPSSSSSSPVPPPEPPQSVEQISYPLAPPAPAPAPAPVVPTPAPDLPAHVVATGGPCQMLGQVAQAGDGSALFCTEDPGGAGPLWLPAGVGDGAATNGDFTQPGDAQVVDATHAGIGQAYSGGPCMQEGLAVSGPGGAVLTCSLTGGGDVPGGLYWQ